MRSVFENLFVLEMANNHLGSLERAHKIITSYGQVARFNYVRAAMKFQFRDVDNFIHKNFRDRGDVRYIKKTLDTQMSWSNYRELAQAVRANNMITMATPFDEVSVDKCVELNIQIVKIASSDIKDWVLIEKIATANKPVIISTGGSLLNDMDDVVTFFNRRNIPLAINHCVSLYPTEDGELELNQVDFLKDRYPNNVIGFSSHEYHDWRYSLMMAYAKGARTFERHVDIDFQGVAVSPYCSLPEQVDEWFKGFNKAQEVCGAAGTAKRIPPEREVRYLDALVRGVYAKHNLPAGHVLTGDDVYLAVPLLQGQISCRELMRGEVLKEAVKADAPVLFNTIDSPYAQNSTLRQIIDLRGLEWTPPVDQVPPAKTTLRAVKAVGEQAD